MNEHAGDLIPGAIEASARRMGGIIPGALVAARVNGGERVEDEAGLGGVSFVAGERVRIRQVVSGLKGECLDRPRIVGAHNAWAVETLTFKAADNLAYAYTLTGDERYAAKASLILDALAAIYPSCDKGSWDYPSHPPSGRFNRPWYQVARVLVHYVDQYDQVFPSPSLEVPSLKPGLTRRQNIEANLLKNGGAYCFAESQSGGLNNGEADYLRGALAVGVCLELPEYIRWAVDGPFGIYSMLENNLDRDGQYFETSTLYASHSRGLHLTFAVPLLNYRGSAYPQVVNLYQHPKFRRFLQLLDSSLDCAGHSPRFGDSSPDTARISRSEEHTSELQS